MISKQIDTLDHLPCQCGKPARVMEVRCTGGVVKYRVEAVCCQMITVLLRSPQAAAYEFGRLRAVLAQENLVLSATAQQTRTITHIRGMGR